MRTSSTRPPTDSRAHQLNEHETHAVLRSIARCSRQEAEQSPAEPCVLSPGVFRVALQVCHEGGYEFGVPAAALLSVARVSVDGDDPVEVAARQRAAATRAWKREHERRESRQAENEAWWTERRRRIGFWRTAAARSCRRPPLRLARCLARVRAPRARRGAGRLGASRAGPARPGADDPPLAARSASAGRRT